MLVSTLLWRNPSRSCSAPVIHPRNCRLVVVGTLVDLVDTRWMTRVLRVPCLADVRRLEGSQGRPGGAVDVGCLEVSRVRGLRFAEGSSLALVVDPGSPDIRDPRSFL